ncbi:hypothetical protein ACFLT2_10345 [Acidobacteriota bacterium]
MKENLTGVGMINKVMFKQIQTFRRQGYSKGSIARALKIDQRTVAKYFAMEEEYYRTYRRGHLFRGKAFDTLQEEIFKVYEANFFRPLMVSSVYDYLEERYGNLPGNEQTLRNYVGYLIETETLKLKRTGRLYTKVPELPFGKQMQLDFGRFRCRSGLVLYIFASILSASRFKYVMFQGQPFKTLDVIRHLLDAFDYFGGRPEEIVIDQDSLMVFSENAGDIIYTKDFKYVIEEQECGLYVCRKADPESKGKVENVVKFVKGNYLSTRDFEEIKEANTGVLKWLSRRANGKICQATRQIPAVLMEQERRYLRPIRNSIFRKDLLPGREERTANDKAKISVLASNYQLPIRYRNKTVEIYTTGDKLFVFDMYTGKEIIAHDLSLIPGQTVSTRACRRETERKLEDLKAYVRGLFPLDSWKCFAERNFRTFPRYVRDQCLEAKKFFAGKEIDTGILERSLSFCHENDTPSFRNLKDTYVHFETQSRLPEPVAVVGEKVPGRHKPVAVSHRSVCEYEDVARGRTVS